MDREFSDVSFVLQDLIVNNHNSIRLRQTARGDGTEDEWFVGELRKEESDAKKHRAAARCRVVL